MNHVLDIRGPVFPLPTPFDEDGSLDLPGLERYAAFLADSGAETLMVTVGTSRFGLLTIDEMLAVNEAAVRGAGNGARVVVTTPSHGPLAQARAFVEHAADAGAAGILAVYPDRLYTEDAVCDWFGAVARGAGLPVLVHLEPIRGGRAAYAPRTSPSLDLVRRIAALPGVCGMKEESNAPGLTYAYNRHLPREFTVIGGAGGMRAHLTARMWGQPAYLASIGSFAPRLELGFHAALERGDLDAAKAVVFGKEEPFFAVAVELGWHVALKEAMASRGLMQPWERAPMARLTPGERERLAAVTPGEDGA